MPTRNFAIATVLHPYGSGDTSIVLQAGQAAKFGSTPFMAVWWNATDYARPSDDPAVEIVRVTAIAGDTLTIERGQEGTAASAKNAAGKTYQLYQTITAAMWDRLADQHVHEQTNPSATWTINHNLGKYPAILFEDETGTVFGGAVIYPSANQAVATFNAAKRGKAYCN